MCRRIKIILHPSSPPSLSSLPPSPSLPPSLPPSLVSVPPPSPPSFPLPQFIYEEAGVKKHWMTIRYAAALLRKVVDCLAPSMTAMLVRGKEVRTRKENSLMQVLLSSPSSLHPSPSLPLSLSPSLLPSLPSSLTGHHRCVWLP